MGLPAVVFISSSFSLPGRKEHTPVPFVIVQANAAFVQTNSIVVQPISVSMQMGSCLLQAISGFLNLDFIFMQTIPGVLQAISVAGRRLHESVRHMQDDGIFP